MAKVKVRIAVGVDEEGSWGATGWGSKDQFESSHMQNLMLDAAVEGLDGANEVLYWITAELDIPKAPEIKEIEGKVEQNS